MTLRLVGHLPLPDGYSEQERLSYFVLKHSIDGLQCLLTKQFTDAITSSLLHNTEVHLHHKNIQPLQNALCAPVDETGLQNPTQPLQTSDMPWDNDVSYGHDEDKNFYDIDDYDNDEDATSLLNTILDTDNRITSDN
eukprot:6232053-Ditylum_brightwellii.AAC.1